MKAVFRSCLVLIALGLMAMSMPAMAQYPNRTITAVVPFAAGSSNDTVARIITPRLAQALGQTVIVQNKPGADALIGIEFVAKTPADGYTLLFSAGAVVLAPSLHKTISYDPERQIMGIASIGISPYIIAVSTKLKVNTLVELLEHIKANPGKLNVPTSGNSSRVFAELLKQVTNTQFTIVNYDGTGAAATSLLGGETDFALLDSASFNIVTPDRVKLLAVAGDKPIASLPNLPTSVQAGLAGYNASAFFGLFMPGGTPAAIADRLNAEVNKIIAMPEVVTELSRLGITPNPTSRQAFDERYHSELIMWKGVVTKANMPLAD